MVDNSGRATDNSDHPVGGDPALDCHDLGLMFQVIRDFRGAMVGRADKGIIITTGIFTREAKAEALREGAPPLRAVGQEMGTWGETDDTGG